MAGHRIEFSFPSLDKYNVQSGDDQDAISAALVKLRDTPNTDSLLHKPEPKPDAANPDPPANPNVSVLLGDRNWTISVEKRQQGFYVVGLSNKI